MEHDLTESPAQNSRPRVKCSPRDYVATLVKAAKGAAGRLATLSTAVKNQALVGHGRRAGGARSGTAGRQ